MIEEHFSVIDTATHPVTQHPLPGSKVRSIAITPDGSKAYMADVSRSVVSVIDTATKSQAAPGIAAGNGPVDLALTPDGKRVYVASTRDTEVTAIDTSTDTLIAPKINLSLGNVERDGNAIAFTSVAGPDLTAPVLAKKVVVEPVRGKVKTKCRGEKKFTALSSAEQIPVGCLVDTRKGTVRLTSSKGKKGGTQSADFWSGLFRVTQKAGKRPDTELALAGSLGCGKSKKKKGKKRSFASPDRSAANSRMAASISKKRSGGRKLWGKGKGRFKTKGKYGSASVRGTNWLVEDKCNKSTFFKVKSGVVKVRDFVKKKNVKVKKGRSYVARARRG